ncbi:rhodanese-like domain-containing protein [Alteromonas sediminis]|uniref:Rhodanese-like domain-containing protein n=1 Tax=Alteromonas sediminis TaxID=2259342 RepID=A0A3N5Y237_9ALTE|nr:rhodanese-like domain-containing protein [Alteromonas sediminis]RPJ67867.1 rhodanese-like domain-containing protein [Alteromonas sediminis]
MKKFFLVLLLSLPMQLWAETQTISVQEVHQALISEQGIKGTLVDVRTPEEFAAGHIPGAINIPHKDIEAHLATLSPLEKEGLILFCRSGKRAGYAIEKLKDAGMSNLTHMEGDMKAWFAAELPIETP